MPLRKNQTLAPPPALTDDCHWTFLFLIMMPNTVAAIARAVRRNDYPLAFLCISVCLCFFLLQSCLTKYLSLPKTEKSSRKLWMKLNMWFLYTAISFGFVYQFEDFFHPKMTASLYGVVSLCSAFLFYVFVVVDIVKYLKNWRYGVDEHRLPRSVSIWEKV